MPSSALNGISTSVSLQLRPRSRHFTTTLFNRLDPCVYSLVLRRALKGCNPGTDVDAFARRTALPYSLTPHHRYYSTDTAPTQPVVPPPEKLTMLTSTSPPPPSPQTPDAPIVFSVEEDPEFHRATLWFESVFPLIPQWLLQVIPGIGAGYAAAMETYAKRFSLDETRPQVDGAAVATMSMGRTLQVNTSVNPELAAELSKRNIVLAKDENTHVQSGGASAALGLLLPLKWPENCTFTVVSVIPNPKEGGVFVSFKYKGGTVDEPLALIRKHLAKNRVRGLGGFGRIIKVYMVKGTPWVEDLILRVPSRTLRVDSGAQVDIQTLFDEFRPFGRLVDIQTVAPTKDLKGFAVVKYLHARAATSARNCIHGDTIGGAPLSIGYVTVIFDNKGAAWVSEGVSLGRRKPTGVDPIARRYPCPSLADNL